MISALFPGFLAAGALFAAVPVVLHLLSRQPPDRQELPTARFLREDRRTLLRLTNRPTDLLLLLTRVLFALALGVGFAGVTWNVEREQHARIVLVDVEAAAAIGMDSLQSALRAAVTSSPDDETSVRTVAYAIDETGALLTSGEPAELLDAVGAPWSSAADGLRALRADVADDASVDTVEASWVLQPTWRQWALGVGLSRVAFWPGALDIRPVGGSTDTAGGTPEIIGEGTVARVVGTIGFPDGSPIHRSLEALGIESVDAGVGGEAPPTVVATDASLDEIETLLDRARTGATVVLAGALPTSENLAEVPWDARIEDSPTPITAAVLLRPGRLPLTISGPVSNGAPAPGSAVLAVSEGAHPVASYRRVGAGCLVYSAVPLHDEGWAGVNGYVDYVDDLLSACGRPARETGVLDRGALFALARPDLPARIPAVDVAGAAGVPVSPWFLLLALVLLGVEWALTRRRRA